MNITDDIDFDTWFDIFQEHTRKKLGYQGPIDKYSFEDEYEQEKSPEEAAAEFVKEMRG